MKLSHGWWVMAGFSTLKARTYPSGLTARLVTFYKTFTLLNFTQDDFPAVASIQCGQVLPASLSIAPALCRRLVGGTSALWLADLLNWRTCSWLNIDTRVFNCPSFKIKNIWGRFEGR
jgi:hypothetical protein